MTTPETATLNLIPMAGLGSRFSEAGYEQPKPLIEVGEGIPMIVKAASCLPPAAQHCFICRQEHVDEAGIDETLQDAFPGCTVLPIDYTTDGQVSSCLIAREQIRAAGWFNIGACDNYMVYDRAAFQALQQSPVDAVIWTFRNNPVVQQDPRMYGWVEVEGSRATRVSVKVPLSETPMNDHAVIGAFSFRNGQDFLSCADQLINADRRIKNEFYIDELMNVAIEEGLRVEVFEVTQYIGWGTPADLRVFQFWKSFFQHEPAW